MLIKLLVEITQEAIIHKILLPDELFIVNTVTSLYRRTLCKHPHAKEPC